jgi:hypothetical protein
VLVNQTGYQVAVAAKFQDPESGQWIDRWNNQVVPGQAVRLGFTSNQVIFIHADYIGNDGTMNSYIDGSDATFSTPSGDLGMRRAIVTIEGNDLIGSLIP